MEVEQEGLGKACREAYVILQSSEDGLLEKIPREVWAYLLANMDREYSFEVPENSELEDVPIRGDTKEILLKIFREYFCELDKE